MTARHVASIGYVDTRSGDRSVMEQFVRFLVEHSDLGDRVAVVSAEFPFFGAIPPLALLIVDVCPYGRLETVQVDALLGRLHSASPPGFVVVLYDDALRWPDEQLRLAQLREEGIVALPKRAPVVLSWLTRAIPRLCGWIDDAAGGAGG